MSKFRIGDRVRLNQAYGQRSAGTEATVTGFSPDTYYLIYTDDPEIACYEHRLDLVVTEFNISTATDQELVDEFRRRARENKELFDAITARGYACFYDGIRITVAVPDKMTFTKTETVTKEL